MVDITITEKKHIKQLEVEGGQFELGIVLVLAGAEKQASDDEIKEALSRFAHADFGSSQSLNEPMDEEERSQFVGTYPLKSGGELQIVTLEDRSFTIISEPEEW